MTIKFNRNFEAIIQLQNGDFLTITYPMTIQISINKSATSKANSGEFIIKGLSKENRRHIFKDKNQMTFRKFILKAGYGNKLFTIFSGDIMEAYSIKSGAEIHTIINSTDGGLAMSNAFANLTLDKVDSGLDLVKQLSSSMSIQGINGVGQVGELKDMYPRGIVTEGKVWNDLCELFDYDIFIENGEIHKLSKDEVRNIEILKISAESGLLETPRGIGEFIQLNIVFEPNAVIGQVCELESIIEPVYNGQYKIVSIKHNGIISGTESGTMQTSLELQIPPNKSFKYV